MDNKNVKRVLIYRTGSLGDSIMTIPCFHKIKKQFPGAYIILLTNKPIATKAAPLEAILGNNFFDEVINYPVGIRDPKELYDLYKQIRALKVDVMINLTTTRLTRSSALRDLLFFKATGIPRLVGFPTAKENVEIRIDPETGVQEWEAKRLSRRLLEFGKIDLEDESYWALDFTEEELKKASGLKAELSDSPIIAISLGTKCDSNNWELHNWVKLISALNSKLVGWNLLVIGANEESALAQSCLEAWQHTGLDLCGKTSPRVSAAILKDAAVFVGHDSGPIHLAGCVGVPSVGVYSARNQPYRWFPRGRHNKIFYNPPECAGCRLVVCVEQKKKCILSITIPEVVNAILSIVAPQLSQKAVPGSV